MTDTQPMRGTRAGVMPPTISRDHGGPRYKFRDSARGVTPQRAAELEKLRVTLDKLATYPAGPARRPSAPRTPPQPWRGATVPDVRPAAPPAPAPRCGCGYLKGSRGCQAQCGDAG